MSNLRWPDFFRMGKTWDIRDKRGVVMAGRNDNGIKCLLLRQLLSSFRERYLPAICDSQPTSPFEDPPSMKSNEHATFVLACVPW